MFGSSTYPSGEVYTYIFIIDITNRGSPQHIQTYEFQGRYFDGRKNGASGYVYLVSVQQIQNILPWYKLSQFGQRNNVGTIVQFPPFSPPVAAFINIVSFDLRTPSTFEFRMKTVVTENSH